MERERYFCSRNEQVCSAVMAEASAWALKVSTSLFSSVMKASAFSATATASFAQRANSSSVRNSGILRIQYPPQSQRSAGERRREIGQYQVRVREKGINLKGRDASEKEPYGLNGTRESKGNEEGKGY